VKHIKENELVPQVTAMHRFQTCGTLSLLIRPLERDRDARGTKMRDDNAPFYISSFFATCTLISVYYEQRGNKLCSGIAYFIIA